MEEILKLLYEINTKLDKMNFISDGNGAIRKCDSLGRITLPIAIRRNLGIEEDTELKVLLINNRIVIEKAE